MHVRTRDYTVNEINVRQLFCLPNMYVIQVILFILMKVEQYLLKIVSET